jgi:aspartate/methionine/tyrosine aminotransferase
LKPSGIRKFFELARSMTNPIDLSIGQPEFDVPAPIQDATIHAIREGKNGYTVTQGIEPLRERLMQRHADRFGAGEVADEEVMVTSGVSGGLTIAFLAVLDPGDEILIPDPYFPLYPQLVTMLGARAVAYDTYPDFTIDTGKILPLVTERTRAILVNSPSNPTGHAMSEGEARALAEFADERGLLIISDEIYEDFVFEGRHVSPREFSRNCIVLSGASKSMGVTGWRIGWMLGRRDLIERCYVAQQFTFVCAPAPAQWGALAGLDQDLTWIREAYRKKRDIIHAGLHEMYPMQRSGGSIYAFPHIPRGTTLDRFMDACIQRQLLVVPGTACSERDTHFRISFAAENDKLDMAVDLLNDIALRSDTDS